MSKFMKGLIKFILVDILILAIGLIFFFRMTKTVDVSWTNEDYVSAVKKSKVAISEIDKLNLVDSFNGAVSCSGKNEITESFSDKEVSAILSAANNRKGPIKDIKIRFLGNNEAEANFTIDQKLIDMLKANGASNKMIQDYGFMLDTLAGTPMYAKVILNGFTKDSVKLRLEEAYLGNIQIGEEQLNKIQESLNPIVNTIILRYREVSIYNLKVESGKVIFSGTLPGRID